MEEEEEKGGEVGGEDYNYDNLTHLADYLETASGAKRKINPFVSLAALLLLVLLSETEKVF